MKSSIFFLQFLVNDLMDFASINKIKSIKISKFLKKLKTITPTPQKPFVIPTPTFITFSKKDTIFNKF